MSTVFDFRGTDIVLLVTGISGAGKSTFINALLSQECERKMAVGTNLNACTKAIDCVAVDLTTSTQCKREYRLVLVDTPGFEGGGQKRDMEVLSLIRGWLNDSIRFPTGKPRGGVLYLHDCERQESSADIYSEGEQSFLSLLKLQLHGHLVLATTKGHRLRAKVHCEGRQQLMRRWESYLPPGSELYDIDAEARNAWDVVKGFLSQAEVQFHNTDVVILLAGLVGSGRSTFANELLKESPPRMQVGNSGSLMACTRQVNYACVRPSVPRDYRLVIVDTPGFDNADKSDISVMKEIVAWLRTSYPTGRCRGGIIWLHDISQDRFQVSDMKALDGALRSGQRQLLIATTKWDHIDIEGANKRRRLLATCLGHVSKDANMVDFKRADSQDAWKIVEDFLPALEAGVGFTFSATMRKRGSGNAVLAKMVLAIRRMLNGGGQ